MNIDIERLYAEQFPRLRSFALRMLGDEEAASDVAQETFAAAIGKADSFRAESSASTWLFAIAKNLCLQRLKGARERSFGDLEAIIEARSEAPSAARSDAERSFYVEEVKQGCLLGLLQCLPFAQRCVFVLHLLNEVPIALVARVMERSENSIRILLSRARASMNAFLCRNCSLMKEGNRCSCENMIEFSLERGLIEKYRPTAVLPAIKAELKRFADEVELYRSLPEADAALSRLIESGNYEILAKK